MAGQLAALCGQILVVGLAGTELSASERQALESGARGGVVFFRRNVPQGPEGARAVAALARQVRDAAPADAPPLVAIDQEGGRVVRIGPPALALPPMRRIGDLGDVDFAARLAEAQARELAALGITMSFAPVADIHTRAENPIIGDRAFSDTPEGVAAFAGAWARGLLRGGVLSCLKHFPGHGDTTVDSHLALPRVERSREDLERIEIAPFRALARDPAVASMMTAHVVYPALDPGPATLSRAVCTDLIRGALGFEGVLFSDDLEMKAIQLPVGEAAVLAVAAGCDALLICSREDLADEAHGALVREAEASAAFRARCEEARERVLRMRRRVPPKPVDASSLDGVFDASRSITQELASRLDTGRPS
ncbi:MAG: beta-N-acetylhexosaminidase [Labilithrix sp.]|nr:beta-N-acetylhexosaminidase [Labilithrix sp.]